MQTWKIIDIENVNDDDDCHESGTRSSSFKLQLLVSNQTTVKLNQK